MPVEVTVRFAGTLIDVVVVEPGRAFRLGTAPGVDLPIPGLMSFPLVDSTGAVRVPAGAQVTHTGEIVLGNVGITIARHTPVAPLARQPIDRSAGPYLAVALFAHLALWLTATTARPFEPPPERPRLARITHPAPPAPQRSAGRGGEGTGAAMQIEEGKMGKRGSDRAQGQYVMGGADLGAAMANLIGDTDLGVAFTDMKPTYREEDASGTEFGGAQQKFDPSTRPGFESVKVGRYATVDHGRGAGDEYHLDGETTLEIELCASKACVATGAIDRASVHSWIAPHAADFRGCFDGTADVLVDFTIANGVVHGAHGRGASGKCAATIVSGIAFPHTDGTTRVRYEVTYRRS